MVALTLLISHIALISISGLIKHRLVFNSINGIVMVVFMFNKIIGFAEAWERRNKLIMNTLLLAIGLTWVGYLFNKFYEFDI